MQGYVPTKELDQCIADIERRQRESAELDQKPMEALSKWKPIGSGWLYALRNNTCGWPFWIRHPFQDHHQWKRFFGLKAFSIRLRRVS